MQTMHPYVLFVDDDESNLIVWETAASPRWPVLTASSGEEALRLLRTHEVGVVLADQRMPQMTGVELLEKIRYLYPDTVRILITAYSDLDAAVDAINRGHVRRYLRKPCPLPELFAEITDALDLYDLRERVRLLERRVVLTERVYALGVIAAGIGRELERPTMWIKDSVTLARREIGTIAAKLETEGADLKVLKSRLAELQGGLDRALRGVDRIFDLAHSVARPTTDFEEGADLPEVIRLVLRVARGEFRERVEVLVDVHPVPRVRGSAAQLGQVALSLLIHAFEAVGQSEMKKKGLITVRAKQQDDTVRLEVLDNGPPLPQEEIARLFDPLYQSKERTTSGLGLAVAKAIVEDLGGRLDITSAQEGGALLRACLPIHSPQLDSVTTHIAWQTNDELGTNPDLARNVDSPL